LKNRLIRFIPSFLRPSVKEIYIFVTDFFSEVTDRLNRNMTPSQSMIFVGSGDFEKVGQLFKNYFIELGNLQPDDRVLDVGCGIGRMAVPLTHYLSKNGEYWGFDIVKAGIKWCQTRVSSRFRNFHFQHSDIYNKQYNPTGKVQAQDFQFPFENEFFDFIFLTSVFTHMLPSDMENYLKEISRVLKASGTCVITFFILNKESMNLIHSGRSSLDFKYQLGDCLVVDESVPELAIAYEEETVRKLFENYGLVINEPIQYGSWCRRQDFLTYQDLIVAKKAIRNKPLPV
jgi:SAM-dependent methyltransferase